MKKILACASLFFAVATASAQGTLGKNKAQINAGVGISNWGVPVFVGVDYGVARDFTIGAELSYRSKKESYSYLGESSEIQNQSGDLFGNFIITGLTGDSSSLDLVKVRYRPFSPTCEINEGNVSSLSFSIRQRGKQDVCFKLESQYCKLQQVTCN